MTRGRKPISSRTNRLADRVEFVAALAANWARLRAAKPASRRVALIMANYPNRDGRLGNGVGLDTPAGTWHILHAMREQGYPVASVPTDGDALINHMMAGPTNAARDGREIRETISLNQYRSFFATASAIDSRRCYLALGAAGGRSVLHAAG